MLWLISLSSSEALETRQNVGRLRGIGPEDARELGQAMRGIRQSNRSFIKSALHTHIWMAGKRKRPMQNC
jgi:hypothetical protein